MIDTEQVRAMSDVPTTFTMHGKEFKLSPPTLEDIMFALEHVRTQRAKAAANAVADRNNIELVSAASGKGASEPIGWGDVVIDLGGQLKLMERLCLRAGAQFSDFSLFLKAVKPTELLTIREKIFTLCGLGLPAAEDSKLPLEVPAST